MKARKNLNILGWMFYDFANSSFTTVIISVVYSAYFVKVVARTVCFEVFIPFFGSKVLVLTPETLWGISISVSMILVAISSPIFGAVADYSRSKKKFLFYNCYLTIIFTGLLFFVGKGDISKGMLFFIIANFGFNSANVFYDAFLPEITHHQEMGKVSGYGWAFGYLGGLVALIIALVLTRIDVRLVFPAIALFFFVFSMFTLIWLKEFRKPSKRTNYFKTALQRINYSYNNIRKIPELLKFLISYFVYNDGITTVIVFASIYGITRFGLTTKDMIVYFILAQLTSIIGSSIFGDLTDRIGVKLSLTISLLIWIAVVTGAFFCLGKTWWVIKFLGYSRVNLTDYHFVGMLAGLAIGSSQSNSRTMLAMLTPGDKQAEFFGFYTLTGRLSSILGPILYAEIGRRTGSPKWAVLSVLVFFLTGMVILQTVRVDKGIMEAKKLSQ